MSIVIKGMDMPTNCADCPLSVIGYSEISGEQTRICFVIPKHFPLTIHKLQDCPLIEIPTPHGRLIDENDLIDHYWYYDADDEEGHFSRNVCEYDIERTPTILEAEE